MVSKLDDAFRFNETALRLRSERQQVLASNIANADTPNYKARDFDFGAALKNAMSDQPAGGLTQTNPTHIPGGPSVADSIAGAPLLYRHPEQGSIDGNTVDMDVERNQFADNALRYEAGLTMVNAQIRNLLAAIQG
jgi:flagellar basal-body rod protein FlgB